MVGGATSGSGSASASIGRRSSSSVGSSGRDVRSRRRRSREPPRRSRPWRWTLGVSARPSRIQPSLAARAVHRLHTSRRVPPAMKGSASSPRRSVRPHTSQDTAAWDVVIALRVIDVRGYRAVENVGALGRSGSCCASCTTFWARCAGTSS